VEQHRRSEQKATRFDMKSVREDGSFEGYASLFGAEDLGRDVVMPGAFRSSLSKRGPRGIKMLYQHDPNEVIGVWLKLREDMRGLFVEGKLLPDVGRSREVLSLMRAGAIDGLSIGYHVVKAKADAKTGLRQLIEVDLWEISVVTFPMLPEARISAVKAARPTEREFERWLTRDAGFSRSDARLIIAAGYKALNTRDATMRRRPERMPGDATARAIRAAADIFRH
jgi:HK97 family phage prohead protease